MASLLYPVILSGGSGTRLWPMSRSMYPKQFMNLGGRTLFENTLERCRAIGGSERPIVVCNEEHRFYAAASLQQADMLGSIVLEPIGRNTAPAIALAALRALELADGDGTAKDGAPVLLILPSDHRLRPVETFVQAVREALPAAAAGRLVTFGITPTKACTAFGYIVAGGEPQDGCLPVRSFREKPDAATAQALIAAGGCFWNSGMFLFRADAYLAELRRLAPELHGAVAAAWAGRRRDHDFLRPDKKLFAACPADSIDYAVMERTDRAAVRPLNVEWNDLGSWEAFYEITPKDAKHNATVGDVILKDSSGCYVHSTHRLVAALGLTDVAVVETADAVFVSRRQDVRRVGGIVKILKERRRPESELHPVVYRPWGTYEGLARGERFQVKRIVVKPGAALSLQKHYHRAEHWIVVGGTAEVTVGDDVRLLTENESTYIPVGTVHRLKNPGRLPLVIVEIQSGSYLGEDDIVRLEDKYGRKGE